ncbi:hypothetical protein [Pectobacterium phage PcCB7V]|nr:hypothetical protein [Pectobacterium phage PcCB7V]
MLYRDELDCYSGTQLHGPALSSNAWKFTTMSKEERRK